MRKRFLVIAVVLILAAIAAVFLLVRPVAAPVELLRVCPEAWYDNQMPPVQPGEQRQYFVIAGERREFDEVDVAWVRANCEIKEPTVVY